MTVAMTSVDSVSNQAVTCLLVRGVS